ncbi:hypothetical protein ACFL04_00930 [Patescibacteria group bacterium]
MKIANISVVRPKIRVKLLLCTMAMIIPGLAFLYFLRSSDHAATFIFHGYLICLAGYVCLRAKKITAENTLDIPWYESTYLVGGYIALVLLIINLLLSAANHTLGFALLILLADVFYLAITMFTISYAFYAREDHLARDT